MFRNFKKINNKYLFCLLYIIAFFIIPINSFEKNFDQINNNYMYSNDLISIFSSSPNLYINQDGNFLLSENKINNAKKIEYGPDKGVRLFICLTKDNSSIPEFSRGLWFELDSSKYENYCTRSVGNYTLIGHVYSSRPDIKGTLMEEPAKKSFDAPPNRMKTDISYDEKYSKLYSNSDAYPNIYSMISSLASDIKEYSTLAIISEDDIMYLKLVGGLSVGSNYWYQEWNKNGESDGPKNNLGAQSDYIRFTLGKEKCPISEIRIPENLWNLCTMVRMYGIRVNNEKLVKQAESIIFEYNLSPNNPWGNISENEYQTRFETTLKFLNGK